MKALILNSGTGSRMGVLTSEHPKCMTEISPNETIISRQLKQLSEMRMKEETMAMELFEEIINKLEWFTNIRIKSIFS